MSEGGLFQQFIVSISVPYIIKKIDFIDKLRHLLYLQVLRLSKKSSESLAFSCFYGIIKKVMKGAENRKTRKKSN